MAIERKSYLSSEKAFSERSAKVNEWKKAQEGVTRYPAGQVKDKDGNVLYEYLEGARLWIGNEKEVMDSCQKPWAIETVNKAFLTLESRKNIDVLERGFGMGIIAGQVMNHLRLAGGSYTIIELNEQVSAYAKTAWLYKQRMIEEAIDTSPLGGKHNGSNVSFKIIDGDAIKETEKLATKEKRFDIIISDTFPLTEDEKSINDLLDLETLVKCLKPNGVFAFFGYHSGSEGGMNERQRNLVEKHFENVARTMVKGINPPPDYKYFNPPEGPIRELPVIICTKPRI